MEAVILATTLAFLVFIIGIALGQRIEAKSWEKQADYDTPKHRHGFFWYVLTEDQFIELERRARKVHTEVPRP